MSGSPPLPPRASQEAAEPSQGGYRQAATTIAATTISTTGTQDVHRGITGATGVGGMTTAQSDGGVQSRMQRPMSAPTLGPLPPSMTGFFAGHASHASASYAPETAVSEGRERAPYAHPNYDHGYAPGVPLAAPFSYTSQHSQTTITPPQGYTSQGPGPGPVGGPATAGPSSWSQPFRFGRDVSPKTRKVKGHVASACVPCKRAHLRSENAGNRLQVHAWRGWLHDRPRRKLLGGLICLSQRPCSRCISSGKEDACVDVQHKKRGRPRLREERDLRYVAGVPPETSYRARQSSSLWRPVPLSGGGSLDDSRQNPSYRVLNPQPAEPSAPRFPDRGSVAEANMYPAPPTMSTRVPEPAVFLTTELEIAKASSTFLEAVGRSTVQGLKLSDLVVAAERKRVSSFHMQMQEEQRRKDPTYLPPIFGKEEESRVMQTLGFSREELSRYTLDRSGLLTFVGQDGQTRQLPLRMGLAKQDSIYFVVMALSWGMRPLQPLAPSPNPRDMLYAYQPLQQSYSQPTSAMAPFDPRQSRRSSAAYPPIQAAPPPLSHLPPRPPPPPPPQCSQQRLLSGTPGPHPPPPPLSGLMFTAPPTYAPSPARPQYSTEQPAYQIPRSELQLSMASHSQHGIPSPSYQLPPIRSPQPQNPPPQSRDDRSRFNIGGLIDPHPSPRPPAPS